jgi:hypothetical protein
LAEAMPEDATRARIMEAHRTAMRIFLLIMVSSAPFVSIACG